jgi:hypothetical protein
VAAIIAFDDLGISCLPLVIFSGQKEFAHMVFWCVVEYC